MALNFTKGEIIAIDKPYRMTSFGALAYVRKRISVKSGVKRVKTGHAGTLDPLATGVLVLCTGKKTKEIERIGPLQGVHGHAAARSHHPQLRHGA